MESRIERIERERGREEESYRTYREGEREMESRIERIERERERERGDENSLWSSGVLMSCS
jgi:hypothetical protein